jgi:molecular chaperone GrpE (heat shock protein)
LEHAREVQSIRLELDEANEKLRRVTDELQRTRQRSKLEVEQAVNQRLESILQAVCGPAAQLLAQQAILSGGQDVSARDCLILARQMIRGLEAEGLKPEGTTGAVVHFDANLHEPLGDQRIAPGEPVVIRVVGMWFQDRYLRKAAVEPNERV